mmetsp:Transcript_36985/g.92057  ORF Transcript_36985/g.92057 Transcript_36985/m.92057 type:complete len:245 (+) Transcript_36985:696-1430(+)
MRGSPLGVAASAHRSMYDQSARRLYRCCRVLPCNVAAAAPHARASGSTSCATYLAGSSSYPMRTLMVRGVRAMVPDMARTTACMRANPVSSRSSVDPAPLAHTPSIGHPMLMSTKRQSTSLSRSSPQRDIRSGQPPHTCTPKHRSLLCLRSSAHSPRSPLSRLDAMAISEMVTSAPIATHTRRKGRLPTVVSGATYSCPRKSTGTGVFRGSRPPGSRDPNIPDRFMGVRGTGAHVASCARDSMY